MFITWDDFGGFYDHVAPTADRHVRPRLPRAASSSSRRTRRGHYRSHAGGVLSVLKFIETDFDLPPLTDRDKNTADMTQDFDFTQTPRASHAQQRATITPNERCRLPDVLGVSRRSRAPSGCRDRELVARGVALSPPLERAPRRRAQRRRRPRDRRATAIESTARGSMWMTRDRACPPRRRHVETLVHERRFERLAPSELHLTRQVRRQHHATAEAWSRSAARSASSAPLGLASGQMGLGGDSRRHRALEPSRAALRCSFPVDGRARTSSRAPVICARPGPLTSIATRHGPGSRSDRMGTMARGPGGVLAGDVQRVRLGATVHGSTSSRKVVIRST